MPISVKIPRAGRGVPPVIAVGFDADSETVVAARSLARAALRPGRRRIVAAQSDEVVDVGRVGGELDVETRVGLVHLAR